MFQPFANNGELVWNALDNLAGSNDLISIRGRASYSRPFERVDALRRDADARFRATEQQLEAELNQTEETLTKLQSAQPGGSEAILSAEQAREIERFQDEKLRIRKELRAVKSRPRAATSSRSACGSRSSTSCWCRCCSPAWRCWSRCGIAAVVMPSPCCAREPRHDAQSRSSDARRRRRRVADRRPVAVAASLQPAGAISAAAACSRTSRLRSAMSARSASRRATAAAPPCASSADGWTVVEREYPADSGRVRELALGLARMKIIERKTSDPANYPKLGVEAPDTPTAASTLVEVVAGKKTWPLIVGKNAEGRAVYVRKPDGSRQRARRTRDQRRSGPEALDRPPAHRRAGAGVHDIAVKPASGPAYLLTRAKRGDADLALSPDPEGPQGGEQHVAQRAGGRAGVVQLRRRATGASRRRTRRDRSRHLPHLRRPGVRVRRRKEADKAYITVTAQPRRGAGGTVPGTGRRQAPAAPRRRHRRHPRRPPQPPATPAPAADQTRRAAGRARQGL